MTDPATSKAGAVALALGVNLEVGLSVQQATQLSRENDRNELGVMPRVPAWRRGVQRAGPVNPSAGRNRHCAGDLWVMEVPERRHGWPVDAAVAFLIVSLNGVLGLMQVPGPKAPWPCWRA